MLLMISGIALLGVVTAAVASWFVGRVAEAARTEDMAARAEDDAADAAADEAMRAEIRALAEEVRQLRAQLGDGLPLRAPGAG